MSNQEEEEKNFRLQKAIEAYKSTQYKEDYNGTIRKAANAYNVKKSTLSARITGKNKKSRIEEAQQRQKLSVVEEQTLSNYLLQLSDLHFPVTMALARRMAEGIYQQKYKSTELKLGVHWIERFMKRHPDLSRRFTGRMNRVRVGAFNREVLENHFAKLGRLYEDIRFRGCNIYNLDEKGLMMGVANRSKVIVRRGSRLQALCQDTNRELITVVECVCADGTTVSPMIIFKGAAHFYGWHPEYIDSADASDNHDKFRFVYGFSEKGYIDYDLLLGWLKTAFEPQTAQKLAHPREWRLLIWDGHESHMNFDVLEFCNSHRIKIFKLPSHSTHLLQPLDLAVFAAFQHNYSCEIDKASRLGRSSIGKHNFLQFLRPARNATFKKPELVRSAFRISGIWPYNPTQVYDRIILPSPQPAVSGRDLS